MTRKFAELSDKMRPAARAASDARAQQMLAEMPLHELRKARAMTQVTLAATMERSQGEISQLERRTDCYVSTLRSYIEAMGGELDIVARFQDGVVKITQFADVEVPPQRGS